VLTERRLSALRANQRRIIDEWGDEVTLGVRAPGSGPAKPAPRPGGPASNGPGGGVQAAMAALEAIEAKEESDGNASMGTVR